MGNTQRLLSFFFFHQWISTIMIIIIIIGADLFFHLSCIKRANKNNNSFQTKYNQKCNLLCHFKISIAECKQSRHAFVVATNPVFIRYRQWPLSFLTHTKNIVSKAKTITPVDIPDWKKKIIVICCCDGGRENVHVFIIIRSGIFWWR